MNQHCPFCNIRDGVLLANEVGVAILDRYPVAEGHALIIPLQHLASLYELSDADQAALWSLVAQARQWLADEYKPDGFNVGVNDGRAAGQTVGHAHIHVIPRREGDVPDPKGGIRWVIPDKAAYWETGL